MRTYDIVDFWDLEAREAEEERKAAAQRIADQMRAAKEAWRDRKWRAQNSRTLVPAKLAKAKRRVG
jgi:hypothetical protein